MPTNLKAKYAGIILRPRITEKASFLLEKNVHTFEVASDATKNQVVKTLKAYYKVNPIKVRIIKNPAKKVFIRGKRGVKPGVKKVYVYLKEGQKLES